VAEAGGRAREGGVGDWELALVEMAILGKRSGKLGASAGEANAGDGGGRRARGKSHVTLNRPRGRLRQLLTLLVSILDLNEIT
jgi:hypothetical protein